VGRSRRTFGMKFGEAAINWIPGILKRKFPRSAKSVHKGHLSGRLAPRLDEEVRPAQPAESFLLVHGLERCQVVGTRGEEAAEGSRQGPFGMKEGGK